MIISHNLYAMDSYNRLNVNVVGVQKSSEKLATGYRINRAADDAAGLAMSEKMRSQIRGLAQATRNVQDGINFVQTAEGALGEIHTVLQRCKELATESANGTYSDDIDRDAVQLEIDQLRDEVEHIAMTDFNGRHCFEVDGSRFLPAYERSRNAVGFAVQGGVVSEQKAQTTAAQLIVDLDNGEKMCIGLEFDEKTFYSLDDEVSDVSGHYAGQGVTNQAIKDFAVKLRDKVIPGVLAGIARSLNDITQKRTMNGIKIGFDLYVDNSNTLASVSSDGNSFKLSINMNTVKAKDGQIIIDDDLLGTLAHEMTHAVMFDTVSTGMVGDGYQGNTGDPLRSWFVEGSAEVVGGGMDRLYDILPWENHSKTSSENLTLGGQKLSDLINNPPDAAYIKNWMKSLDSTSQTGQQSSYKQGYAATMYLSWLAGGGANNSSAPINSTTIANGLDKILMEINSGKSLSQVIDEVTGAKYKGLNDFETKIRNGDDDIAKFLQGLIATTGASRNVYDKKGGGYDTGVDADGSIIASGGLGGKLNSLSGSNNHFTLDLENTSDAIYGDGSNIPVKDFHKYTALFEGGGATKNSSGVAYVEGSADTNPSTPIPATPADPTPSGDPTFDADPDPDDPVDPGNNPPGGGGTTDPTDPDNPGGGGNTDPTDPDNPGGGGGGGGTDPTNPDPDNPNPGGGGGGGGTDPDNPNPGGGNTSGGGGTSSGSSFGTFRDNLTPLNPFILQVGARSKDAVHFTFEYTSSGIGDLRSDMNCTGQGLGLNGISVSTQSSANEAIDKLDFAINKVSLMRATYGSIGSRLQHKIADLTVTHENLSESESHIRDTDMAEEIMRFTKGQILRQSAQSMLTQANQIPHGALQLLS